MLKERRIPKSSPNATMEYPRFLMIDFNGPFLNWRTSPLLFSEMHHRLGTSTDADTRGELNHQLIRDEGKPNEDRNSRKKAQEAQKRRT
jgi:hypothetical protein